MFNLIKAISDILTRSQKRESIYIFFLLIISVFFEIGGLGILLPAISLMLSPDIVIKFPILRPWLELLGNPSHAKLVIIGMILLILYYICKTGFSIYFTWKQSNYNAKVSGELSEKLFNIYVNESYVFHLNRNSSDLIKVLNETSIFSAVIQSYITVLSECAAILGISLTLVFIEPLGTIGISLFMGVVVYIFQKSTKSRLLNWGHSRNVLGLMLNKEMSHSFGGIKDIKLLGIEDFFLNQFKKINASLINVLAKYNTIILLPRYYLELIAVIALTGLISILAFQEKANELMVPTIGLFAAAAFRLIPSVNRIISSIQQIRYSEPYILNVCKEFELKLNPPYNVEKFNSFESQNSININNISFSYSKDAIVLNNISLQIEKGQTIGIIGTSGSGKSTLIDLLLGLLTPSQGEITVDGVNIQSDLRSWQNNLGYVPQNIFLIDDTILSNIALGVAESDIDFDALNRAINDSDLAVFIDSLELGLNTEVGERGVRLSGGQRQRIGIARALYRNPQILVLDEATSALDNDTERSVMSSINSLKHSKTIIIIAHRLSTVKNCDIIYKISKGRIVEFGHPSIIL